MSSIKALIDYITHQTASMSWQQRVAFLSEFSAKRIVFSTSFSKEDQLMTHAIAESELDIHCFTLDTGRLFEETYDVMQRTTRAYGVEIKAYYPDAEHLAAYVAKDGINGFYDSVASRKQCCHIRKVEPLTRALRGSDIWISGLRREQSALRGNLPIAEWDAMHEVVKYYPLLDATTEDIEQAIQLHQLPYNSLHDKGYLSIGCAPCTRAVQPGEHSRAGRWWWEEDAANECGLHLVEGKLVSAAFMQQKTHQREVEDAE